MSDSIRTTQLTKSARTKSFLLLSRSSIFGRTEHLFNGRFLLESTGWQITLCGVQLHAVVEVDDEVGDVTRRLSLIDVVVLADALHFMSGHASTTLSPWIPIIGKTCLHVARVKDTLG